ncbi:PREDICTED: uncharacterized protein At2g29880-like isoform X2 [Erythranthe guttata]|uniref:uncharacterized protein At2g29880-like isoform X2 n=1 Tax=Erythranthe guttata TaxID=4155 RepID=UPI00064DFE10|nr:PREDICTED: uncharacterized protein At2g29880-like isoform X2 [Erythranthe guttata]|eukprot:XP_012844393.1 PREDICTED: uncharacterized protein At2g29880-like isoform X2 [Erythranthe guttata]
MEASQNSLQTMPGMKKEKNSRRVWTREQEDALIIALKELINNGWRADNGFRAGYLQALESALAAKVRGSNLLASKHIVSKLIVWKRIYGQLQGMTNTSGFGWKQESNMIVVEDDVWKSYAKVHPDVENMRHKTFPFYEDWKEIFGRDRADGLNAQGFVDVLQELVEKNAVEANSEKEKNSYVEADVDVPDPYVNLLSDASDDAVPITQDVERGSTKKDKRLKKSILGKK